VASTASICGRCLSSYRRQVGAVYTADVAVQAALLASIPILAAMLPGDALNCVYSGASGGQSVAEQWGRQHN